MIDLVPFTPTDVDRLIGWSPSIEALQLWTASSFDFPLTRERLEGHLRDSAQRGDRLIYKAVTPEDGRIVGHVELGAIDDDHRSLRSGRGLRAPAVRWPGLGTAFVCVRCSPIVDAV